MRKGIVAAILVLVSSAGVAPAAVTNAAGLSLTTNSTWLETNGPGVYAVSIVTVSNTLINPRVFQLKIPLPPRLQPRQETNTVFDHLLPTSLNYEVWTNVIARTNGRTMQLWSQREHPPGWPRKAPIVRWNPTNLLWGMRGLTALCPCWEGEGAPGQVPITALTRRHGYARGHSMGPRGFGTAFAGRKVWFLTLDNKIAEVKILRHVVASNADYTIMLFDRDLPRSIEPMRVADHAGFSSRFLFKPEFPQTLLYTEQWGNVSAGVPGFKVPTMKGGDSGSPNLLPLDNELVFTGGRTTSPASQQMQKDMNELCRLGHLDPRRFQLQWADLSQYPVFAKGIP